MRTDYPENYDLREFVVLVMDMLGQRHFLANWSQWPTNEQEDHDFWEGLRKTAGSVVALTLGLQGHFDGWTRQPPAWWNRVSSEDQDRYRKSTSITPKAQRFSDTFVVFAPLADRDGTLLVESIYRIFGLASSLMLVSLAGKVPLRGGLTAGIGLELEDGFFYGPALAEAHRLESCVADYPRLVVADRVAAFLTRVAPYCADARLDMLQRVNAKMAASMLARDDDGLLILDYLGPACSELLRAGVDTPPAFTVAEAWIRQQAARFAAEQDSKLAGRYRRLLAYFERSMPNWTTPR